MSSRLPSVLWQCWLGGRKGIRPLKTEWWGAGMVICLERGADLHMAQLMPLSLTVSCFSKIHIGCTSLVPAHPGSPGKGPLNLYVYLSSRSSVWLECCEDQVETNYNVAHVIDCSALLTLTLSLANLSLTYDFDFWLAVVITHTHVKY